MPGKAYTMREMKSIVDYLKEHKNYSEMKGRKMWMDFANTRTIDRTWQSLKETFLKRILPDIHNPYYKLTMEEIRSFRQGHDVQERNKNKLEIHTVSDDTASSTGDNNKNEAQPSTSKESEENPGEDIKCSKIQTRNKSSTDTLILENCYETAEDVRRDLESPMKVDKDNENKSTKSFRDYITYSEPLTPMLQEVIDDFATDDEDPPMQIVEDEVDKPVEEDKQTSTSAEILESQSLITKKPPQATNQAPDSGNEKFSKPEASKIKSLKLKKTQKGTWEPKDGNTAEVTTSTIVEDDKTEPNNNSGNADEPKNDDTKIASNTVEKILVKNDDNSVQLCSNSTTDTQLPNNQEALGKRSSSEKRKSNESPILGCPESQNNKASQKKRRKRSVGKKSRNNSSEKTTETQDKVANVSSDNNSKAKGLAVSEVLQELENSEDHEHVDEVEKTTEKVQTKENKENKTGSFIIDASESNPCLKTVSLFDEQFSTSKYIDSESDKEQKSTTEPEVGNHDKPSEINADDQNQSVNSEKPEKQTENSQATSDPIKNPDQNNIETPKDARSKNLPSAHNFNDVVVLKSHSESETDDFEPPLKRRNSIRRTNHSRDRALANVFGFSSGAAIRKRTRSYHDNTASRRYSQRKRTLSRNVTNKVESGSSDEYTTASDSEDLSPVRNRRNGLISMQKYAKPESFNILSNPNGELFVVGRKKIYPIIMRNGTAANFACWPESDDDTDNSYWKLKYVEEKKRAAEEKIRADELARLLDRANERQKARDATSIGLEAQSMTTILEKVQRQSETDDDYNKKSEEKLETSKEERGQEKTVKIKFTKNNEIELECQWPHFQPVLEKMAQMFHKNVDESTNNDKSKQQKPEQVTESKSNADSNIGDKAKEPETESKVEKPEAKRTRKASTATKSAKSPVTGSKTSLEPVVEVSSGKSSPVNSAEVRQKVDKLESEIFKEIEERDKTENNIDKTEDPNVTTRKRGRPRKQSTLSLSVTPIESPAKEMPAEEENDQAAEINEKSNETDALSESGTSKRQTRAPKRYTSDTSSSTTIRKEKMNQSAPSKSEIEVHIPEDDSGVRYMLPPRSRSRSETRKGAKTANKKTNKSYLTKTPKILSSPDTSRHSIDSTQGYQDSDNSLPNLSLKRKKKTSLSGFSIRRNRSKIRRKSYPYLGDDDSNEAEYPSSLPAKLSSENSSVNTEVYTSESYRLLLPRTKSFRQLHKIDENAIDAEPTARFKTLSPITINIYNDFEEKSGIIENKIDFPNTLSSRSGEGNSSSVSLPLSPELSIVEKLSISKEMLGSVEDHPTINEMQGNNSSTQSTDYNKYLISDVDISVPLMEQDCELRQSLKNNENKPTVTESLLDQIGTVNIEQFSSDSLNQKLGDLLLESAKKVALQMQVDVEQHMDNAMDVDAIVPKEKRTRAKKRSSTPLKRKNLKKSKEPAIEPVVEEHVESCSKGGRKSCPPIINVTNVESEVNITDDAQNISTEAIYTKGSRRKKDIIKVKILKPKEKKAKRSSSSRNSVCTDSGINEESEIFLQECNDSVELIHNHSETCLHANECIGDSVEFVENSKSVISLNSNSGILYDKCSCEMNDKLEELISPELFCNNAQDATSLNNAIKPPNDDVDTASTGTIFHSLNSYASFNSLLTEDMSNETPNPPKENAPKSKWYLLSEDETNTNLVNAFSQNNSRGSGSNLHQIFPVACAVPNLSTISEMSKENNSTKPVDTDVDTGNFSESSLYNSFV